MNKIESILVGLDFSPLDKEVISYTAMIGSLLGVKKVYFFHIAKTLHLPDYLNELYPELKKPKDEILKNDMIKEVEEFFKPQINIETQFEVKEGNPSEKILKWADIKEVDLVIMGTKNKLKGAGVLPGKMVKLMHCSVLLIPEKSVQKIDNILVPVDYSTSSESAAEMAIQISNSSGAKITFQHCYEVPIGYHSTGKSYEEFAEIMEKNAGKDFDTFKKQVHQIPKDVKCILTLDEDSNPAEIIAEIANEQHYDLIIIASRGRTNLASILVGSVAEKMLKYPKNIPEMVVKNKHDNLSFFEAILKL